MSSIYFAIFLCFFPSPIRICIYRLLGAKIGKRVKIGFGTVILSKKLEIGDNSKIGYFCKIKVDTLSLGKYVSIGNFVKISVYKIRMDSRAIVSSTAEIEGDSGDSRSVIKLGMHSWIFQHCYINVIRQVTLGKNVGLGGGTFLFTHGYWLGKLDGFPISCQPVTIDDNVWIPWDCFIMPGVTIGKNVVVGARALINKDVPQNTLVAGVPARVIKEKSFQDVSYEEKIKIVKESVCSFADRQNKSIEIIEINHKIQFLLNKLPFLILYERGQIDTTGLPKNVLNVFFDEVPENIFESYPCFSLKEYLSSSYGLIPDTAKEWLQFSRCIGLRFYPIDEISN